MPWRDGCGFAPAQLLDHVQHLLFGEASFALQLLHQGQGLPHVGDAQVFEGDDDGAKVRRIGQEAVN